MIEEQELNTRLIELGAILARDGTLADQVLSQVKLHRSHDRLSRGSLKRRILQSSFGLAAAAALLLAMWSTIAPPKAAYGIEAMADAMAKVKSLHVKGTICHFKEGKLVAQAPTEYFVERPYRFWSTGAGFSDNALPKLSYRARDGKSSIFVVPDEKRCYLGGDSPLLAELDVEGAIQGRLLYKLLGASPKGFHKVGEEKIDGRIAHRYERVQQASPAEGDGDKLVVWLNPDNGLPLRAAGYVFVGPNPGDLVMSWTEDLEVNVPPRANLFDFTPPDGYDVIRSNGRESPFQSVSGIGDESSRSGPALNINDRALLIGWAAYDRSRTPDLEEELEGPWGREIAPGKFSVVSGDRKYRHIFLRTDADEDFHWRWTLAVPEDPKQKIGFDMPTLRIKCAGGSASHTLFGLRFPRERLAKLVVELQQFTLPADAPAGSAFTLDELEALIEKLGGERE